MRPLRAMSVMPACQPQQGGTVTSAVVSREYWDAQARLRQTAEWFLRQFRFGPLWFREPVACGGAMHYYDDSTVGDGI